jgi:energy-coupling factor transporter ATP-binding protein EcfA2
VKEREDVPGRNLNDLERNLLKRWDSGFGPSLRSIEISGDSSLRGLTWVTVDFRYPLVIIAGKNGTGKSTLLACAACAYQNTGSYELYIQGGKHFRFGDFFFTTPPETPFLNIQVRWTYRLEDKTTSIKAVTKGPSKWKGYNKRPNRAVEFVGLLRALHPSELRVLRRHFGTGKAPDLADLDDTHQAAVSQVMSRSYAAVRVRASRRYSLHYLDVDGCCYSGFNMGSGEDVACQLTRIVHRLPRGSLLIIEEIETGLHPAAQRNLIQQLLKLCDEKYLQVICSSHSQAVLECVPAMARVLLKRHGSTLQPCYGVSVGEAMSDMAVQSVPELSVYVEDDLAHSLLLMALPADIRQRVRVTTCGSWADVIRFLAVFRRDPKLGAVAGILDGDRVGKDNEHIRVFRDCPGGTTTDEGQEWLTTRLYCLPGTASPERYLCTLGTDATFREYLASALKADRAVVDDFFQSPPTSDSHNLSYDLGQRVGLGPEQTETVLVAAASHCKSEDFQPIIEFLQSRLQAET